MNHKLIFVLLILFATTVSGCGFAKVVTSGDYTLESGETLRGSLLVTSGQVTLEAGSRVTGRVLVTSGDVNANGDIDGDLVITSGDVHLGPNAVVRGDIIQTSGNLTGPGGARVEDETTAGVGLRGSVAGAIISSCVLPLVLVGIVVGGILFLVIGRKRRGQAVIAPPEVGPAGGRGIQVREPSVTSDVPVFKVGADEAGAGLESVRETSGPLSQTPTVSESPARDPSDPPLKDSGPEKPAMTVNADRYQILEKIGQGGFATVYRARDKKLDRLVALKELRSVLLQDTAWVKRFRQEAKTIARLDHPRIVTIHDVHETRERLFIVMRLVAGPGLDELINTRGRLPWSEAVDIFTAVAEGLDYAHSKDILHRDLKPANILIDSERGPLLSDFGLAKLVGENSLSATGDIVGTPYYIAPEVWDGQGATPQSDIYALGCILYEMLTGEKVFKGETPPQVMMAHFSPLKLPDVWPEDVPAGVAELLETSTAREPANRYATASETAKRLADLTA